MAQLLASEAVKATETEDAAYDKAFELYLEAECSFPFEILEDWVHSELRKEGRI